MSAERDGRAKLDWGQVMERLQASTQAMSGGAQLSPERRRALLRQRSQELARPESSTNAGQKFLSVLGFRLGSRNFAVESRAVMEVFPYRDIVPVPCTPNYVLGLVNARGQIVSVTDLKVFLGIPPARATRESKILFLQNPTIECGILVDGLHDIQEISIQSIQLEARTGASVDFVWGTTADGITVIDVDKLLSDRRLVIGE